MTTSQPAEDQPEYIVENWVSRDDVYPPTGTPMLDAARARSGLLEVPASELRPGDRVSFGDHTGWYRVRRVGLNYAPNGNYYDQLLIAAWPRRFGKRIEWRPIIVASEVDHVWVQR